MNRSPIELSWTANKLTILGIRFNQISPVYHKPNHLQMVYATHRGGEGNITVFSAAGYLNAQLRHFSQIHLTEQFRPLPPLKRIIREVEVCKSDIEYSSAGISYRSTHETIFHSLRRRGVIRRATHISMM